MTLMCRRENAGSCENCPARDGLEPPREQNVVCCASLAPASRQSRVHEAAALVQEIRRYPARRPASLAQPEAGTRDAPPRGSMKGVSPTLATQEIRSSIIS